MENNNNTTDNNQQENTNQNANSAYSGSGSMQPGTGTGEARKLNDYSNEQDQEETLEKTKPETTGKSIAEATDPSKLSDI